MRKILTATAVVAALLAGGASYAKAGTITSNMTITVTLQSNCLFGTQNLAATYLPGAGNVSVTNATAVSVACSPDTVTPTVSFNGGSSGAVTARTAAAGASKLAYNLWTAPTGGTILGDGTGGTTTVAVTTSTIAAPKQIPVTLIVPDSAANQALPAGTYTDTVVATLTF